MLAAEIRQDVIANNLANATNPGFKGDKLVQQAFGDMLLSNTQTGDLLGPLSLGTQVKSITVDLANGGPQFDGRPLDLAVAGEGWFAIGAAGGTTYTRNGAFTTNAAGQIVTAQGDPVLDPKGKPIVIPGGGQVSIGRDGSVSVGGAIVGQIGIVALTPGSVTHLGMNQYAGTPTGKAATGAVAQGALEASNVNTVTEMVSLIENMREFEADQKASRALDDTLDKAVNQVGRV
jgi:flagellar basal-body rod protein FlgG